MSSLQQSAIVDGEILVEAGGTTDFNELERELGKGNSERLTHAPTAFVNAARTPPLVITMKRPESGNG
jgi:hypothetical protein